MLHCQWRHCDAKSKLCSHQNGIFNTSVYHFDVTERFAVHTVLNPTSTCFSGFWFCLNVTGLETLFTLLLFMLYKVLYTGLEFFDCQLKYAIEVSFLSETKMQKETFNANSGPLEVCSGIAGVFQACVFKHVSLHFIIKIYQVVFSLTFH